MDESSVESSVELSDELSVEPSDELSVEPSVALSSLGEDESLFDADGEEFAFGNEHAANAVNAKLSISASMPILFMALVLYLLGRDEMENAFGFFYHVVGRALCLLVREYGTFFVKVRYDNRNIFVNRFFLR